MAEINIVDQANKVVGKRELNPAVFDVETDTGFVHRVYTALAQAQRFGSHHTKNRSEVSGGGKKPWKQKGTGRARQGSTRAAQWRHGGTAHGPRAHDYYTRINRKERRLAVCMVLSDAVRAGRVTVLNKFEMDAPKTKEFAAVAKNLDVANGLFVLGAPNAAVERSGRNIPNVKVVLGGQVNLHDLMKFDRVVLTEEALSGLEGTLTGGAE